MSISVRLLAISVLVLLLLQSVSVTPSISTYRSEWVDEHPEGSDWGDAGASTLCNMPILQDSAAIGLQPGIWGKTDLRVNIVATQSDVNNGYLNQYRDVVAYVKRVIDAWSLEKPQLGGHLKSFTFTVTSTRSPDEEADIIMNMVDSLGGALGVARTRFDSSGAIRQVQVSVVRGLASQIQTWNVMLHEYTHALGLGHANYSGDVMSYCRNRSEFNGLSTLELISFSLAYDWVRSGRFYLGSLNKNDIPISLALKDFSVYSYSGTTTTTTQPQLEATSFRNFEHELNSEKGTYRVQLVDSKGTPLSSIDVAVAWGNTYEYKYQAERGAVYPKFTEKTDSRGYVNIETSGVSPGLYFKLLFEFGGDERYQASKSEAIAQSKAESTKEAIQFEDSATAKGVQESDPYEPIDRTYSFYTSDEKAYAWIKWVNVPSPKHIVEFKWFDPNGALYTTVNVDIQDPKEKGYDSWGWYKTWSWISINGYQASDKPGLWTVQIYIDNIPARTLYLFLRS